MQHTLGAIHGARWVDVEWPAESLSVAQRWAASREESVHVVRASLAPTAEVSNALASHLDAEELHRASRYRFEDDQRRYATSRGLLREVLGKLLHTPPCALKLRSALFEKPSLHGHDRLQFNVSHCSDEWLLAISATRRLGVDIERFRGGTEEEALLRSVMSPIELNAAMPLPPDARQSLLRSSWVVKEACLKATGVGLSEPMSSFSVPLPSADRHVMVPALPGGGTSPWQVIRLPVGSDPECITAALVIEGEAPVELSLWDLHFSPGGPDGQCKFPRLSLTQEKL